MDFSPASIPVDSYITTSFQTSLRHSQCLLSLFHCYLVIEYLPLTNSDINHQYLTISSCIFYLKIGFNHLLLGLGLISFFFSGLFMEYNEKQRQFRLFRYEAPVLESSRDIITVNGWFPVGMPEAVSLFLAIAWLLISVVISVCIPDLDVYLSPSATYVTPSLLFSEISKTRFLASLWSATHQFNAIAWTASAFLAIFDLLHFLG